MVAVRQLARRPDQLQPQLHRVAPERLRQLVDEALRRERPKRVQRAAPPPHGEPERNGHDLALIVRHHTGRIRVGIAHPHPLRVTHLSRIAELARRRGHAVRPPGHLSLRIHRRAQLVHPERTIEVVRHVVLARPHQLDRLPHRLRHLHRLAHEVVAEPPPEATPRPRQLHLDRRARNPGQFAHQPAHVVGDLRRRDDRRTIAPQVDGAVLRLHRGVREERDGVARRVLACGTRARARRSPRHGGRRSRAAPAPRSPTAPAPRSCRRPTGSRSTRCAMPPVP